MPSAKLKKFLLGLLILFVVILAVEQAFLLYQKGYFKSGFIEKLTKQVPTSGKTVEEVLPVSTVSDFQNYDFKIANISILNDYLRQFGFIKGGNQSIFGNDTSQPVDELVVHLTDQSQPFLKGRAQGEEVFSAGSAIDGQTLHLLLFRKNPLDEDGENLGFDRLFLDTIYTLGEKDETGQFEDLFVDFRNKNQPIFEIVKKQ